MATTAVSRSIATDQPPLLQTEQSQIRKYTVLPEKASNAEFSSSQTDIFDLSVNLREKILLTLNQLFAQIEQSKDPGASYLVKISGCKNAKSSAKRLEISLEVSGSREPNTSIKTSTAESCSYCKKKEHESFSNPTEASARVVNKLKLKDSPIIITVEHKEHWFDANLNEQIEMLSTAEKILNTLGKNNACTYELRIPVGGEKTISHAQMDIAIGLGLCLKI